MSLAERVVGIALAQVGVREDDAPNSGEPSRRYMGGRCEPWCGWFVAFCFREAGRPLPGDAVPDGRASALASVAHMEWVFRQHGWLVRQPMPGDVVFFRGRGASDRGPGRHVGLVVETAYHYVRSCEGNTGDCVRTVQYRRSTLEQIVTSFGRVPDLDEGSG